MILRDYCDCNIIRENVLASQCSFSLKQNKFIVMCTFARGSVFLHLENKSQDISALTDISPLANMCRLLDTTYICIFINMHVVVLMP